MTVVALLGDLDLGHLTHRALQTAVEAFPPEIDARWVGSDEPLGEHDGLWVIPGSPYRDDDAVLAAIRVAAADGTPFLGTCGGFQYAALALAGGAHAETEPDAPEPLVGALACSLVGQEREVTCVPGTRLAAICGTAPFTGFHWCGYGVADGVRLEAAGAVINAHAPDAGVEGFELPDHPCFLATLFQPQVSAPDHPLITAFLAAAARASSPRPSGR